MGTAGRVFSRGGPAGPARISTSVSPAAVHRPRTRSERPSASRLSNLAFMSDSPGPRPPGIRNAVLWETVDATLDSECRRLGRRLEIVDLGGGTGGLATRAASAGHVVTVVDPSPDALAALERRANEDQVIIRGLQGDTDDLDAVVGMDSADVLFCHGVLELVDDPENALESIGRVVRTGGVLSVVASQVSGGVLSRVLAGQFADGLKTLTDVSLAPPRRFARQQLERLLAAADFTVTGVQGVRIFVDHVSAAMVDLQPGARDALRELEAAVAHEPEFIGVASHLHLVARH
jgi:SAM-dependent methyltransferase